LYIIIFGVLGTIITFLVVTPLTYLANQHNLFYFTFQHTQNIPPSLDNNSDSNTRSTELINNTLRYLTNTVPAHNDDGNSLNLSDQSNLLKFSIKEILLFSSVISATDTVAALTFVKEESDPKLFSILFGEGVINDAVCIVLYKILYDFTSSSEGKFNNFIT
jgi:hypothetical protein